jgi:nucleotide-binding universal stress UspA family protein
MSGSIAVAVDGSEGSRVPLAAAAALALERGAELVGLFVMDTGWADFIGSDWQSSRNARQGFLDYVREAQEGQAGQARRQFEAAAAGVPRARFDILTGEPAEVLLRYLSASGPELLLMSRDAYQVCGRPSLKRLAGLLEKKAASPVVIYP